MTMVVGNNIIKPHDQNNVLTDKNLFPSELLEVPEEIRHDGKCSLTLWKVATGQENILFMAFMAAHRIFTMYLLRV